jgi:hypothetical protein
MIPPNHRKALLDFDERLAGRSVIWALTGSVGHRLQGVPIDVNDIDIQTDKHGAHCIAALFNEAVTEPVRWRESASIRSFFGTLEFHGVTIEIMGAVQKRLPDGTWEQPVDVIAHRVLINFAGRNIPAMGLPYECQAYECLGRLDRAKLLRRFVR